MRAYWPALSLGLMVGLCCPLNVAPAAAASRGMLGVEVSNKSEPQLCAEKDNVALLLSHPAVTHFTIEAAHPLYVDMLQKDNFAPDWTACDIKHDAPTQAAGDLPRKTTLYEDIDLTVVGFSYPGFWRNTVVPIRVEDRVQSGFQYLQVWVRAEERTEEVLVLYPSDGYWRARPLTPPNMGWSAYGSSFVVGPIEDIAAPGGGTRPAVDIKAVEFDPKTRAFTLDFMRGGKATVAISKIDHVHQIIDVAFSAPVSGLPFAALRSMYVTKFNNDVANTAVLEAGAAAWHEDTIMGFTGAKSATDVWAGRLVPSRHNTSAPDMVFSAFSDGTAVASDRHGPAPLATPR